MGDGDGSDGGVGAGDGGVGAGDGGGGVFDNFYTPSASNYDSGGLASIYDDPNDPNNPFKNRKYQGVGFGPGGWEFQNAMTNMGGGVDTVGSQVYTPVDQNLVSSLGFTGSMSGSQGDKEQAGNSALWDKFLSDKGLQIARRYEGINGISQAFDKSGNAVGTSGHWNENDFDSPEFGLILSGLAAAAGGVAGAGLAAGAGYGAGTAIGGAAAGAGAGFAGTAARTADVGDSLKGAAVGGATGGLVSGINPAGLAGVTDPAYARAINGAANSGLRAGLTGGNIGSSMLTSAGGSGLSLAGQYGLGALNNMDSDPYANETARFSNYQDPMSGGYSQVPQQGTFDRLAGGSFEPSYSMAPGNANSAPAGIEQYFGSPSGQTDPNKKQIADNGNPIVSRFLSGLNSITNGGAPGRMDNMGANLMDLYSRYRSQRQSSGLAGQLSGLFGPNSAYAQQLEKNLSRHDAATGRRTQFAPRQVELQARLAEMAARQAPTLNSIYNQQAGNRMGMGSDLFRMLSNNPNGGGGLGMLRNLGGYLGGGQQGNLMGANPASDYNYQNGSDIGG